MRRTCLNMVHELAKRDDRVVFIGSDLSPGLLDDMKTSFPDRHYMEGVAEAQRRLGKVFDTQDFTVVLHDGPLAGQEVPHVHVHVMPRTKGDGGRCAGMAAFPDAPPIGSVEPDFAALGALSEKLQAA